MRIGYQIQPNEDHWELDKHILKEQVQKSKGSKEKKGEIGDVMSNTIPGSFLPGERVKQNIT